LAFGSVTQNTTSSAQNLVITNTGSSQLNITGISVSSSQFAVTGPTSTSIAPGSSYTYSVTFKPTAASSYSGNLTFSSNSATAIPTVALSGTGVAAAVTPLVLTTSSLPSGAAGTAYNATMSASGGTAPYTWSLVQGTLPPGLTLSSTGSISGTPSAVGTSSFTVQVKDSAASPQAATATESISITSSTTSASCSRTCYYVSPSGNDSNSGTSSSAPWKTIAKAMSIQSSLLPGDSILFERGGVWYEQFTISNMNGSNGSPVTIGNYGSGNLPVIDGGYTSSSNGRNYCVAGINTSYSYVDIDGIECRNAYTQGITFKAYSGGGHHVTVKNSYVHNTGRGACQSCTVTPSDPGGYVNQLDAQFVDYVTFTNNVLNHCGGHNCLQVHYDEGGSMVSGNKIGTTLSGQNASDNFCVHNCLDIKGGVNNQVINNYVYCPNCKSGAAYYTENTGDRGDAAEHITWIGNVANQHGNGFEAEGGTTGGGTCNTSPCAVYSKYYNNTTYQTGSPFASGSCGAGNGPYMFLDFQKNIWDGGSLYWPGNTCKVTWDYNDNGGVNSISGNPVGAHDLKQVNPQYMNVGSGNFVPQNATILTSGASDSVTAYPYLGAMPPQ
jgi:hypothetical protein